MLKDQERKYHAHLQKGQKKEDPGSTSLTPVPGNVVEKLVLKSISGKLRGGK